MAHTGERCVRITNFTANDARFAQTVSVDPDTCYKLSGWVYVDDTDGEGHGGNISVEGVYVFSENLTAPTNGWSYLELYGYTGEDQTLLTVFARMGGYSGLSTGTAYFDDLCLEEVEMIPAGVTGAVWTNEPVEDDTSYRDDDEEDEEEADPYWPRLLIIGIAYALVAAALCSLLRANREKTALTESRRMPLFFGIGLALSLLTHFLVAQLVDGYQVDVGCFLSWGSTMAQSGASGFYSATSFCDYPPAYVWILGLNSRVTTWLAGLFAGSETLLTLFRASVIHKLIPSLCDVGLAWLVYRLAREKRMDRTQAGLLGLLVAFNPVLMLNSAAWCQMDSVPALLLALVALLAVRGQWTALMPVYMLAVLTKPQALMLGFLGLTAIVREWIGNKAARRGILLGIPAALAVAAVIVIPFSVSQGGIGWLIDLYGSTLSSYAYATVNTANLYYLFRLNWVSIELTAELGVCCALAAFSGLWGVYLWRRQRGMRLALPESLLHGLFAAAFLVCGLAGCSYAVIGYLAMAWAFAAVLPMYLRSAGPECLPMLGALLFLLLYVLGIKMHERYLFPAIVFLAMAFALNRDRRVLALLALASLTMFVNEGVVLDNSVRLGSSMGHLNSDTMPLNLTLSALNVLLVPLALWTAHDLCALRRSSGTDETPVSPLPLKRLTRAQAHQRKAGDPSLHWCRLDTLLVLSVTAVYAALAFCNLGSTKAPQQPWKSTAYDEEVIIDLGEVVEDFNIVYFAQVSYSDFSVAVSNDAVHWSDEYWCEMAQGQCFRWKYATEYSEYSDGTRGYRSGTKHSFTGRYVRVTAQQIGLILNEIIFRDADLNTLPATIALRQNANEASPLYSDPEHLLDEQDTLDGEPSWYNSTYFDEIYHARTAFEHLNGTTAYETTHPPLGKVIMSWCVAVFGMTPFGWRFAGCLFGVLMLPAMYLLGKQLTKRTDMAFLAMCLMTLDCMHLTQTRIATIDSFPVLFIILSWFFMLRFIQHDLTGEPIRRLLPSLGLCGLMFGCSVASKWIGLYSGAGLALVYFWHLGRCVLRETGEERRAAALRALYCCLWCLLFFIAVPVVVYLLSFIPYMAPKRISGLGDYINEVIRACVNMYNYHSTPGLGMDHPFYSPWYEWPVIGRPMYYANSEYIGGGWNYAIFCFGNPAVWYTGLLGLAFTLGVWLKRHRYALEGSDSLLHLRADRDEHEYAFVLLGFLAQFLPWVLVPRGTYIYHYFASLPFLMLGITLLFSRLTERLPRAGRAALTVYMAVCVAFFVGFYPYASGVAVPEGWLDFMKQFLHVYY